MELSALEYIIGEKALSKWLTMYTIMLASYEYTRRVLPLFLPNLFFWRPLSHIICVT